MTSISTDGQLIHKFNRRSSARASEQAFTVTFLVASRSRTVGWLYVLGREPSPSRVGYSSKRRGFDHRPELHARAR